MVKHIVLFTVKESADKETAVKIARSVLEPLVGKIPGLTGLEVRPAYQGSVDFALYSEFESREALAGYADHPAHVEAKAHFWDMLDGRICADYEL